MGNFVTKCMNRVLDDDINDSDFGEKVSRCGHKMRFWFCEKFKNLSKMLDRESEDTKWEDEDDCEYPWESMYSDKVWSPQQIAHGKMIRGLRLSYEERCLLENMKDQQRQMELRPKAPKPEVIVEVIEFAEVKKIDGYID